MAPTGKRANGPEIESLVIALRGLSPRSRELVAPLIIQLAEREGVSVTKTEAPKPKPVAECVGLWAAKLRGEGRSDRTVKMYTYLVGRFLEQRPDPTRADIRQHIDDRLGEGTSPAAVENERKALRSLFSFLHQEGLVPEDPTAGIGHIRVPYNERRCPSVEEVERVLEVGCLRSNDADKIRLIIRLIATTGLRLTEAASLRKDSIDFNSNELWVTGKGRKLRVVPLLPEMAGMLRGYIENRPGDSPFVFPGKTRTGYAKIYNIEKTLRRACLRAGVEPFTPHQLRHLYATEMLRRGAKLEVVGRILGHSSIGITADIYRHVRTEEMHLEAERFAPLNGSRHS
jgi:site-specific recombinase XerD